MDAAVSGEGKDEQRLMRVGQLARRCRKSVRALHLYEEMGLLQPESRTKGGFRLYSEAAQQRVAWIGKLQDMGFSLTEIQVLVQDWARVKTAPQAMTRIRKLLKNRLRQTQAHIDRLTDLKQEMEESLEYLDKCAGCGATDLAQCVACDNDKTPNLIAQFNRPPTGEHVSVEPAGEDDPATGGEKTKKSTIVG